jgi:hypothetical protein
MRLCLSSRNRRFGKRGQHFFALIYEERMIVQEYFELKGLKVGKSTFADGKEIIEELGLCNDRRIQLKANAIYFSDFAMSRPKWPWPFTRNK